MLTGTIINSLTILAGSAVGLVLRAVTRRSSKEVSADGLGGRLQTIIMQGMALCVLYIGVSGCLKGQNTLTAILSIALGAIIMASIIIICALVLLVLAAFPYAPLARITA